MNSTSNEPSRLSWAARVIVTVLVLSFCLTAALAILEWRLSVAARDRESVIGAAGIGRMLTFREYPAASRYWATPWDSTSIYPGGVEARKYILSVDSAGFIEPGATHENPKLAIAFLGGSTTECLFVSPEHRFPYLVGRQLEKDLGLPVNTYNGGRSGNNTMHATLALLAKVVPLRPQYVVLMENINDLTLLLYYSSYWHEKNPRAFIVSNEPESDGGALFQRVARAAFPSVSAAAARSAQALRRRGNLDEFAEIRERAFRLDTVAIVAQYRASLEGFITTSRAWGLEPILMTQASRMHNANDPAVVRAFVDLNRPVAYEVYRKLHRHFNTVMREVATKNGVSLVDLESRLAVDSTTMYDAVHFTDLGSRAVALIVAEHVQSLERRSRGGGVTK